MKKVMTLVVIMAVLLATALPAFAGTGGVDSGSGRSDVGIRPRRARSGEGGGGFGGGFGGKGIGECGGGDGYGKKDESTFMFDPHGPACGGE